MCGPWPRGGRSQGGPEVRPTPAGASLSRDRPATGPATPCGCGQSSRVTPPQPTRSPTARALPGAQAPAGCGDPLPARRHPLAEAGEGGLPPGLAPPQQPRTTAALCPARRMGRPLAEGKALYLPGRKRKSPCRPGRLMEVGEGAAAPGPPPPLGPSCPLPGLPLRESRGPAPRESSG